jgi:hypothetical protein
MAADVIIKMLLETHPAIEPQRLCVCALTPRLIKTFKSEEEGRGGGWLVGKENPYLLSFFSLSSIQLPH